jgi:hypothetical protein
MKLTLPTDSAERKDVPVLSGCMNYFPAALAWIARISVKGDRKHNPENKGPPFHARGKSMDHGDCIVRHTMDIEDMKAAIARSPVVPYDAVDQLLEEAAYRAWRSCAELQELCEKYGAAPLAPAARLPDVTENMYNKAYPNLGKADGQVGCGQAGFQRIPTDGRALARPAGDAFPNLPPTTDKELKNRLVGHITPARDTLPNDVPKRYGPARGEYGPTVNGDNW